MKETQPEIEINPDKDYVNISKPQTKSWDREVLNKGRKISRKVMKTFEPNPNEAKTGGGFISEEDLDPDHHRPPLDRTPDLMKKSDSSSKRKEFRPPNTHIQ